MRLIHFLIVLFLFSFGNSIGQIHSDDPGVALIWYGNQNNLNNREGIVKAGQIVFMWRDFEPKEGRYSFKSLDEQLKIIHGKGLKTTIQINGNLHPDYIFKSVPYLDEVVLPGQKDHTIGYGPPMYWNPVYMEKYSNMIHSLADHLRKSPYRKAVLGIRHNFCAVGTEHHFIPEQYRDSVKWTFNNKVVWGKSMNWTPEIADEYMRWTIDLFIDAFNPPVDFNVFMRASAISTGIASQDHIKMAKEGNLWLFQTSSEPQPRNKTKEEQYRVFEQYCKTGKTVGFMESWSDAETNSEGWNWENTGKPITRTQFNYWTLLCDLHCGASFPAMRPEDVDDPSFQEDYVFASRYAGFLSKPSESPGAWIAFREGDYLKGDYTFLMDSNPEVDKSIPLYNTDESKYGLWSKQIEKNGSIRLKLNYDFLMSLESDPLVKIRIWYKDDNMGILRFRAFTKFHTVNKTASGEWKIAEVLFKIENPDPLIDIIAHEGDLTVHMIEILRASQNN